jgi:hypothetical protein
MRCIVCDVELTGGLDTYGSYDMPMCWDCYSEMAGETIQPYYGLGPHHHDLTITGSFIGSTVFDAQDDPNFSPDPDAPGLGVWHYKNRGWQ